MIDSKRHILFWISSITLLLVSSLSYFVFAGAEQGILRLEIKGLGIRHGTPNNVNLGTPITSSGDQEIIGQFDDNFWVEDLQGNTTGYYTTIQCDGVYGPIGNKLTGVYLKAGNTSPTLIQGYTGNVFIGSGLYDYTNIITPMTYVYKPSNPGNVGLFNDYGDKPRLKIIIPAYSPPGSYSGTIIFSFYSY